MTVQSDTSEFFFFSRERLNALADQYKEQFAQAEPFQHVAIDNFLPDDFALRLAKSFPGINDIDWRVEGPGDSRHSGDKNIEKVTTADEEKFPALVRLMMMQFQSGVFCNFLSRLTGYPQLMGDPNHYGCGLHSTGPGGRLMLHIDASRHPNKDLNQLINCIFYCTPDWKDEWGGGLELWDEDAKECVTVVPPRFNRLAIFKVSGKSWHGHPHPVQCPPDMRRNSLALYYYTTDKEATGYDYANFVQWKGVTEHDKPTPLHRVKSVIRSTFPPAVINGIADFARKTGLNFKK
jgi:Rps23 Pro-64 3,4-dihydroxylase Tpa1-like proline 4-hydroxylase